MLGAIERIRAHVGSATYEEFSANPTVAAAISYELLVIGEAAGRVADDIVDAHPEIPWNKLRGTRNVQGDIPALEDKLRLLIK
jgi:uncharacterized protein with HEPN domain